MALQHSAKLKNSLSLGMGLVAALPASLLGAMYASVLWGHALGETAGTLVFLCVALLAFGGLAIALSRANWAARLVLATLLVCASYAFLPRSSCVGENLTTEQC